MIRVRTGSRLHFGLFALPSEAAGPWLNLDGEPCLARRNFGGVGLMIDRPSIELTVSEAKTWSADGPLNERALRFAQAYCHAMQVDRAFAIHVEAAPPEHSGLGVGTQLGLAVARGLAAATQQPNADTALLAKQVGRGLRSALGVHGFAQGGFLVEGGKSDVDAISPLLLRCEFPSDWQILRVTPGAVQGMHGRREIDAFADLARQPPDDRTTEAMCRLVLLGLLPALAEHDLDGFGEALFDFNRRAGALFRSARHGIYASAQLEEIVLALRGQGIRGVGQSSWGPTLFAVVPGDRIVALRDWLLRVQNLAPDEVRIAAAWNRPAAVTIA